MNRIKTLSRMSPMLANPMPEKAQSILAKGAQIDNLRQAAAAIQEFLEIITKTDTFDNT